MSETEEFSKGQPDKTEALPIDWAGEQEPSSERLDWQNDPPAQTLYLVGSAFFLSGLAALNYEIVWQRVLVRVIGATTPAVATIICAFMIGLAIGGFAGAELAKRRGNQLLLLAVLELLICIVALASVVLCRNSVIVMLTSLLSATVNSITATYLLGFAIVFVLIAIPTSLMGATLPIVAGFFARSIKRGVLLTRFYAINSAGAVFGAFLSGFFLLPMLGISGSLIFAAGLNLLSSSLAFLASRSVRINQLFPASLQSEIARGLTKDTAADRPARVKSNTYFNAVLALCASALSFTMQIVWTRFFVFLFGSSTHALSLVLSVYIAGLALGAWFVSRGKTRNNYRILANIPMTLAFTSLAMASVVHQFQIAPAVFLYVKKFLIEHIGSGFWCDSLAMVLLAVPLILLPAFLIGMVFPLLLTIEGNTAMTDQSGSNRLTLPKRTAILYAASLLGSVVASTYSFTLLPVVAQHFTSGLEVTTVSVSVLFASAALVVLLKQFGKQFQSSSPSLLSREFAAFFPGLFNMRVGRKGRANAEDNITTRESKTEETAPLRFAVNVTSGCLLILCLTGALIICRPQWDAMLIAAGLSNVSTDDIKALPVPELVEALKSSNGGRQGQQLIMYREGVNSTVSVVNKPSANLTYLRNNGKVEAAVPTDPFFPAPESDLPTQKLLGIVPALHCSGDNIEGLVIGYGSGTTCSAILPLPWVQHLTAVELEQAVWDARSYFPTVFSAQAQGAASLQQKLTPVIADARNYLSLREKKFDFIVSQPAEPWLSGASDLFTVEFYQLVKKRLKGTGLFCQWVPLYSLTPAQLRCLVQTFQHAFPQTTIWHPQRAGELILTGQVGKEIAVSEVEKRLQSDTVSLQLQAIGIENRFDLYTNAIQLPSSINQSLEDIVLNTDDNLLIEGKLSKDMNSSTQNIDENFRRVFGDEKNLRYALLPEPSRENALELDLALAKQYSRSQRLATDTTFLYAVADDSSAPDKKQPPLLIPVEFNGTAKVRFYLHNGAPQKAAQLLESLDTSKVTDYMTLCDLGTVEFLIGDYTTALSFYKRAETQTSSQSQAKAGIGLCLWMLGESQKAVAPLTASLALDPNQFLARYALGQTLSRTGRESEALINMRAAALVNPTSVWPGIFVTASDIDRGDWKSADANLQLVLKRKRRMPEALALGCLIALKADRKKEYVDYKNQYRSITARDITNSELDNLVKSILLSPHIVAKIKDGWQEP